MKVSVLPSTTAALFAVLASLTCSSGAKVNTRGVDPAVLHQYTSNQTHFHCLSDGSPLDIESVNDDYCDCADGSDEPGTSACEGRGGVFWCENKGHVSGKVGSGRVGDGICDYDECCDGSDEWQTGLCPDKCAEVGKEYKERIQAELKTRKTGSKIRGTYIKWAQTEKSRLQDSIRQKEGEVAEKEAEVERARVHLEGVEAKSHEALEQRKLSPLYKTLEAQRTLLHRLRAHHTSLESELKELKAILDELKKGYNPNYQDMAVKAAVVGYDELYALPPPPAEEGSASEEKEEKEEKAARVPDWELDAAERKDLEGLLLGDMQSEAKVEDDEGLLYRIDEYIPDLFFEQWDNLREGLVEWLIKLGIIGKAGRASKSLNDAPYVTAARQKHNEAQDSLRRLQNDISHDQTELDKLETGKEYGNDGEWKKLDGTCIDKVSGDYTYELCFFGRAVQKSNKDHSSNHLGTFENWNFSKEPGSYEYYSKQSYRNGAKCWNGPMRSVDVELSCGTTNAIISISEPEKCEYRFKATTPALCYPLDDDAGRAMPQLPAEAGSVSKDEL